MPEKDLNLERVGRAIATGGLSEVLPVQEETTQFTEVSQNPSRLARLGRILSTGGLSLVFKE